VFVVENLLTTELKAAHATRWRVYQDIEHNVTAELAQAAQHNDHQLYVVPKILGPRYNKHGMFHELLVAWPFFPVSEATWEPYSDVAADVPKMATKCVESHNDPDIVSEMRYF
jgi:hypothetical protein